MTVAEKPKRSRAKNSTPKPVSSRTAATDADGNPLYDELPTREIEVIPADEADMPDENGNFASDADIAPSDFGDPAPVVNANAVELLANTSANAAAAPDDDVDEYDPSQAEYIVDVGQVAPDDDEAGDDEAAGLPEPTEPGDETAVATTDGGEEGIVSPDGFVYGDVDMVIPEEVINNFEAWEGVGHMLQKMTRGAQWWLGRWVIAGQAAHGEKYTQAIDNTEYSAQALQDIVYVCTNVPVEIRRPKLTFSHHREVAGLKTNRLKVKWLDLAEKHGWSVHTLRKSIQADGATGDPETKSKLGKRQAAANQTTELQQAYQHIAHLTMLVGKLAEDSGATVGTVINPSDNTRLLLVVKLGGVGQVAFSVPRNQTYGAWYDFDAEAVESLTPEQVHERITEYVNIEVEATV